MLGVWADHLPAACGIGANALVKLAMSSVTRASVVGHPRIYQAANGVWLTDRVQPGYLSGLARLGQDLDVPVRSMHADPLSIPDQLGSLLDPHDGR
jgi:hypothetical protein